MAKVFGNLKQIVNLARVIRVFGTDLEQLVIGSFPFHPFLRRSFSNTQSIDMIISDYLLFPNSTEVLLHGRLGSIHPGFESTMKTLNHVGGPGLVESFLVLLVNFTTRTRKLSTRPRSKLMLLITLVGSLDVSTLVCYPALTKHGDNKAYR